MEGQRLLTYHMTGIAAVDERGPGHANHRYLVYDNSTGVTLQTIQFQCGPVGEEGLNGIQNEDLLRIVIDRLIGFQSGDYPCQENDIALDFCMGALQHLETRTMMRRARGVEGKSIQ